jgi:hypothetical protein
VSALARALGLGLAGLAVTIADPRPVTALVVTVGIAVLASWRALRGWFR